MYALAWEGLVYAKLVIYSFNVSCDRLVLLNKRDHKDFEITDFIDFDQALDS